MGLVCRAVPGAHHGAAITAEGEIREGAEVAELTNLDLSYWPEGTRAIVRRDEPHDGAQFNLFDPGGWRHQVFITNSTDTDITYLEARHRGHARVEDRIRCAKDTGLRTLPFGDFANNACWVELIYVAQDLIAFTQGLVLEGDLAKTEPKRLRYALLHTAGRLSTTSRRTTLALQREWPRATALAEASAGCDRFPSSPEGGAVDEDQTALPGRFFMPQNRSTNSLLMPTVCPPAGLVQISGGTGQLITFQPTSRQVGIRIGWLTKHPG